MLMRDNLFLDNDKPFLPEFGISFSFTLVKVSVLPIKKLQINKNKYELKITNRKCKYHIINAEINYGFFFQGI